MELVGKVSLSTHENLVAEGMLTVIWKLRGILPLKPPSAIVLA